METRTEEDDISRVAEWLKDIKLETTDKVQAEPRTPRRQCETLLYAEASPTDTTFSGASVFDKPDSQLHELSHLRHHRDDASDATRVDENDEGPIKQLIFESTLYSLPSHQQHAAKRDSPIASTAPGSDTPRLTTIVSCLQCILNGLPCSRTPLSCTRCIRNNRASSCLLQRRLFTDEIPAQPAELCIGPVLLKLANEDEEIWRKKMEAKEQLTRVWREKRDRENWVAPKVDESKRGGWKKYGRFQNIGAGIGEGTGRVKFLELVVDAEVVRI
jgi:hypothetical protein